MKDFADPDFTAPLDVAAHVAACPASVEAKGMFFSDILEHVLRAGQPLPTQKRYLAFKNYPNRELLELLPECARLAHPGVPLREALRRLGRSAYPTLADTMIGRVIFGVLGNDLSQVFRVAAKGYAVALTEGRAEVLEVHGNRDKGEARVRLVDIYNFIDCYQVGVFEGAIQVCGKKGDVKVRLQTPYVGELFATWH